MLSDSSPYLITPDSKVGEMLERYPQLEETLISISPAYQALKNPVLRRTVAKVATLRQVARVGNVPLGSLISRLREAVGQEPAQSTEEPAGHQGERPAWADPAAVTRTFDARETIESGGHPMPRVMSDLAELKCDEVYALITPFVPAPLIDLAAGKGFQAWSAAEGPGVVRTYFRKC
jgi:curved DNA-binding protein CbpA